MQGHSLVIGALFVSFLVGGCTGVRKVREVVRGGQDPFAASAPQGGIPPELRAGRSAGQVRTRVAVEGEDPAARASRSGSGPNTSILTPEEDIVWTDPDNPDAELPGLEDMIRQSKKGGDWEASFTEAKKLALREGKPLLMWFTNSDPGKSPVCNTLSGELFATADFDSWAREHVIRLRLDFNVKGEGSVDEKMDTEARKKQYLKQLEERYKVKGKPHVLILAPDGTPMGRYRGYRPDSAEFFWGQLKHSAVLAQEHHDKWVEAMERKGYRTWANERGDFRIFAKLLRYREGELVLVEPDGTRFKTREVHLSEADRLWIAGEKARRR